MYEPFFCLGLGIIEWNKEIDKWDNKVSIITLPDGTKYRMVHHKVRQGKGHLEYATIYAGKNKFMRYRHFTPDRDAEPTTLTIGNYKISWGDGICLGVEVDPNGPPELEAILKQLDEVFTIASEGKIYDGDDLFLMNILLHASQFPIWQSK